MKKVSFIFSFFTAVMLLSSCDKQADKWERLGRWYSDTRRIYLPAKLDPGTSWHYEGNIRGGIFKNFEFTAKVKISDEGIARFWFHTDKELSKGYRVLLCNNSKTEKRRSGSLEGIRSRYKQTTAPGSAFKLYVAVKEKNIRVEIDDVPIVEYTEPELPYRSEENLGMFLSKGFLAFEVLKGKLSVYEASIKPLANYIPTYLNNNMVPPVDETIDKAIRLEQRNIPLLDLHVYAKNAMSQSKMREDMSRSRLCYGILYGQDVLPVLNSDENMLNFITQSRKEPLFFSGIHLENTSLNQDKIAEIQSLFDYYGADAMTITDHKGRRTRLWMNNEVQIDISMQNYMNVIVDNTIKLIKEGNINILFNPTFLPETLDEYYDNLWTYDRINRVVTALASNKVAIEINSQRRIPRFNFLQAAKLMGVKFVIGSDGIGLGDAQVDYSLRMIDSLQLTKDDMFIPD